MYVCHASYVDFIAAQILRSSSRSGFDRYEKSISQMTMDLLLSTYNFLSSITANTFTGHDSINE